MNPFSPGQKNLRFPFSSLITSFLFGCSFENIFLSHLYSPQKTLSSNKYLKGFIELITDRFWKERKIIVRELINVAGTTLNNHAWIISSTNVITEQFRKCEKAGILRSYFLSWPVFWMAFKHPWLNLAGNLLVEPIPNEECRFISMKHCRVWEPVAFGAARMGFKPCLLCRLLAENDQISSCPICPSRGSPLCRLRAGARRLTADFSPGSPRIKGIRR